MTKKQLINLIIPAKIKRWEETGYKNNGYKESELRKNYWSKTKKTLLTEYNILKEKGYIV